MPSVSDAATTILDVQVPATPEGMDVIHQALAASWVRMSPSSCLTDRWQMEFSLAVAEVAANIIQHAQSPEAPFAEFILVLEAVSDRIRARFIDQGVAAVIPASREMPSVAVPYGEIRERGWGLALVQATTDRFEYQRAADGSNVWVIEKILAS